MKKFIYSILILFGFIQGATAQQSGQINFEQLGIGFTIPEGWVGQEANGVYLIASYTKAGVVILAPQEYNTLSAMQTEMQKGYQEANGTTLMPATGIVKLDGNTIGTQYTGTLEGQPAKAFVTGTINEYGQDVVIMAITTANLYSDEYRQLAMTVERSLRFAAPKVAAATNDWKSLLSGVRLTYMNSYYSGSYTDGGVSGGYSTKLIFDLCAQGYFVHNGSDNMTVGSDVSSGYSSGRSQGSGQWEVVGNTLRLKFNNGRVWEYQLSMQDGKTFLDDKRYYRTWTGENKPQCN